MSPAPESLASSCVFTPIIRLSYFLTKPSVGLKKSVFWGQGLHPAPSRLRQGRMIPAILSITLAFSLGVAVCGMILCCSTIAPILLRVSRIREKLRLIFPLCLYDGRSCKGGVETRRIFSDNHNFYEYVVCTVQRCVHLSSIHALFDVDL